MYDVIKANNAAANSTSKRDRRSEPVRPGVESHHIASVVAILQDHIARRSGYPVNYTTPTEFDFVSVSNYLKFI